MAMNRENIFMQKSFIHIYLNLLLLVLAIFANTSYVYMGEFGILEGLQNIFLIIIIYLQLKFRKLFFKFSNKFLFYIRCFSFLFILYEEISIITKGTTKIFKLINIQQEINIHNLTVLNKVFINNLYLPIFGYEVNITFNAFLFILATILFGFGSYISYINKAKFFFIEKEYSIYSLIFLVFVIVNSLNKHKFNYFLNIDFEFCELFLYNLFFIDLLIKINKMENANIRSKNNATS